MFPLALTIIYIFAFGLCIGSFINVVIYRLPREKSIIFPPSECPSCGKRIAFYDNIPVISWLLLRGRCRHCKGPISIRYATVELLTAVTITALFCIYFLTDIRTLGISPAGRLVDPLNIFFNGGWTVYLAHIILLAVLIASSAIDIELWVIPINLCWFATAAAFIFSAVAPFFIDPAVIRNNALFPQASASVAAMAAAGAVGMMVSLALSALKIIKQSYPLDEDMSINSESKKNEDKTHQSEPQYNHREEMLKEIAFLAPIIIAMIIGYILNKSASPADNWWIEFSQNPIVSGLLGSLWGYFVGCAVVWFTRILGTLAFGKEAMGLGDVHLMGAVGAFIGPAPVIGAFFVAPFFGLGSALSRYFFKKSREIPYGPFLSLGAFTVIILHDPYINYIAYAFFGIKNI